MRSFDYLIGLFVPKASAGAMRREVVKAESCKLPLRSLIINLKRLMVMMVMTRMMVMMVMMMKIVMVIENDDGDVNCCHTG